MRRSRAAFLGAGVAALAAPAFAADPQLTTIRFGTTPDEQASTALWGVQSGLFGRTGLDVQVQRLNSGAAVAAGVAGHAIDIGLGSAFNLIQAHLKGIPFVVESVSATSIATLPNNGFAVAKDSPIANPAQLNGKTLSTPSLSDLFTLATTGWIDQNGGDAHTVSFIELPMPLAVNAITSGRVAGAFLVDPFLQQALDSGLVRVLGRPYASIAPRFGVTYYFCLRDYAAANPDALARFRSDVATAVAYARTHWNEIVPIVAGYTGMKADVVRKMPFLTGSGIAPEMLQPVIDFAARYQFIPKSFPATDMIDAAALQAKPA